MKNEKILEITKKFHDTYEKLSKEYDYETRRETKVFDIKSNNGKLMYATVNEIVSPILKENKQLKDNLNKLKEFVLKKQAVLFNTEYTCYSNYSNVLDKIRELEQGSDE